MSVIQERKLNIDIGGVSDHLKKTLKEFRIKKSKYKVFFRGRSFEFDGFRSYSYGEDVSNIDWMASLRSDNLLQRQYKEEDELKVLFLIDISSKMAASGISSKLKCEYSAEVVLSLANLILASGHRAGFVLFNKEVSQVILPRKNIKNIYTLLNTLNNPNIYSGNADFNKALEFVFSNFDSSLDAVILVSDFLSLNKNSKSLFNLLSSRFETFALVIKDPLDSDIPDVKGEFLIEDPNTGQQILIDPKLIKTKYSSFVKSREKVVLDIFRENNIDYLNLYTDKDFVFDLTNFINSRAEEKRVSQ